MLSPRVSDLRVSSGGPVYGSSADNLSMYRTQNGEAEQAAVMKHSLKIERAVGKAEDDIFRAVEKAVGDVEGIAERIRQFRLRMLLTQATYRRATRTKRAPLFAGLTRRCTPFRFRC